MARSALQAMPNDEYRLVFELGVTVHAGTGIETAI